MSRLLRKAVASKWAFCELRRHNALCCSCGFHRRASDSFGDRGSRQTFTAGSAFLLLLLRRLKNAPFGNGSLARSLSIA
jgi:hypothetical protein